MCKFENLYFAKTATICQFSYIQHDAVMIFNPKQGIKTAKVSKMQIQKSVFCESYDDMQLISIYNLYLLYGGECFTGN